MSEGGKRKSLFKTQRVVKLSCDLKLKVKIWLGFKGHKWKKFEVTRNNSKMLVQCKRDALSLNPPFPSRTRIKKKALFKTVIHC